MPLPDDAALDQLARQVLDRTLPKAAWTHEAHFALALWLIRDRGPSVTPETLRPIITRYNDATGTANTDSSGYHHTITVASMRAAADHLRRCGAAMPLHRVLASLMASSLGRSDWLLTYWSREALFSVDARRGWRDPDRMALPF